MAAMDRRRFLNLVANASLLAMAPAALSAPRKTNSGTPDLELELRAGPDKVAIFSGKSTSVWRYRAKVLHGDKNAVAELPDSYLGPVIRMRRGQRVRVHFINDLPQPSIVHWHGLIVPEAADGHPRHAIKPGQRYTYEFEVRNRAGTYWFHPHPHGHTGEQVYAGLAGLFIVGDEEEQALGLPDGAQDVALVIQDRRFDRDNQLSYLGNMMDRMMGFTGDTILVNGRPDFELKAERRAYRLRLLNGSNSRIYKLAWHDSAPITVIGTDGGLLQKAVTRPYITLGPAERVELWLDLSTRTAGERLRLVSLPFDMASMGMMGGMMRRGRQNTSAFDVLSVQVGRGAAQPARLPSKLSAVEPARADQATNHKSPRTFETSMAPMRLGLNEREFEMMEVADDEVVRLGSTEVWRLVNESSMGMMGGMPHPIHIHGVQFRILKRSVHPAAEAAWLGISKGHVDEGWKDTVLLMPGERADVLIRFDGYPGLFLYHCHNLEHEDMGMMRNYLIKG